MPLLSIEFAVFMLAFLPLYWCVARTPKQQNVLLLLASLGWLLAINPWFAVLVDALSAVVFLTASALGGAQRRGRKQIAAAGIAFAVGMLVVFKYFDFFRPAVQQLLGRSEVVDLLMPVGISYYVFQSVAYLVYCYRQPESPRFAWHELLLHLCFFPTLTAGPIIRVQGFKSVSGRQPGAMLQICTQQPREMVRPALAVSLIVLGLAKKWWLAGSLAEGWVSPVFANPMQFDGWSVLAAVYGYTFQLFFDFSGYTDLVTGLAMLMGFRLPENFAAPLRAYNLRDFWARWHISFSTWIRDYIYIPLGGSRGGFGRTQTNLFVAMVLSGIWHGYGWNFLLWGALHGAALVGLNGMDRLLGRRDVLSSRAGCRWLAVLVTFHFVSLTFVVFNAATLGDAGNVFSALLANTQGWVLTDWSNVLLMAAFALLLAVQPWLSRGFERSVSWLETLPPKWWWLPVTPVVWLVTVLAPAGIPNFIYANF